MNRFPGFLHVVGLRSVIAGVLLAAVSGCASVKVNKVDSATGKVIDGAAEGIRFYMPRPYVSVFEPFIVASDVFVAKGELTPDGNYVLLTEVPQGLDSIVGQGLKSGGPPQKMGSVKIESSKVIARSSMGPQGADATVDDPVVKAPDTPAKAEGKDTTSSNGTAGGMLNYKATNDNAAYGVTPQPRYFNILWLPDFDEQYVVTAQAGLGKAGVTINMGRRWSLQGLDANIDNSAIAKPLLDFYSGTFGALQKLATAKIQAPLAALAGGPQSAAAKGEMTGKTEFAGGTHVTVKVTKVRIVAPGLYPILKPNEANKVKLSAEEQKRILAPVPPLTNIAFNTYEAVVIEAARSTGDSALRIQQYVTSTGNDNGVFPDTKSPAPGTATSSKKSVGGPADTLALNAELAKPENMKKTGEYYVATVTYGVPIVATLSISKGDKGGTLEALPSEDAIRQIVASTFKGRKVTISDENITFKK